MMMGGGISLRRVVSVGHRFAPPFGRKNKIASLLCFARSLRRTSLVSQEYGSRHSFGTNVKTTATGGHYVGAGSRTRTYEAERQEIYSLP